MEDIYEGKFLPCVSVTVGGVCTADCIIYKGTLFTGGVHNGCINNFIYDTNMLSMGNNGCIVVYIKGVNKRARLTVSVSAASSQLRLVPTIIVKLVQRK